MLLFSLSLNVIAELTHEWVGFALNCVPCPISNSCIGVELMACKHKRETCISSVTSFEIPQINRVPTMSIVAINRAFATETSDDVGRVGANTQTNFCPNAAMAPALSALALASRFCYGERINVGLLDVFYGEGKCLQVTKCNMCGVQHKRVLRRMSTSCPRNTRPAASYLFITMTQSFDHIRHRLVPFPS